ncbi:hypothetical protein [uncultured Arcticibacterium sp.]|uniref:hypothetical protein n=1 Tax=uncultured Arcticibacterium sp. TaxID=2173042 RepID=UPI0030F735F0
MRLKNLDKVWHRNESCSIFNLPFACYSVQPLFHQKGIKVQKYVVSFKASVLFPEPMDNIFDTVTEAEIACENHLTKLMNYLFGKMEHIIEQDCDKCNAELVTS